jgi:hypothetical protein
MGCFIDSKERDLKNWIGVDMTLEQCIVEAKYEGY